MKMLLENELMFFISTSNEYRSTHDTGTLRNMYRSNVYRINVFRNVSELSRAEFVGSLLTFR